MSASIVQVSGTKECFLCRALKNEQSDTLAELSDQGLERHHIMFGYSSNDRNYSERYGLWVWLCPYHHREAPESVHKSKKTNLALRRIAQMVFEMEYGTDGRLEWMRLFRRNYLEEGDDEKKNDV